jgi:hypothetical protein
MRSARSSGCRNDDRGGGPQALRPFSPATTPGSPQLIVEDAVEVGVVLGEVAGRVAQVSEEVRTDVVPAQPTDVALRVTVEHGGGAPADLVDLPRRVMEEVDGGLLHQHVVVGPWSSAERGKARSLAADLEAEALDEEPLRRFLVDGAEHDVTESARAHRPRSPDGG